jgi:hypothetical protein
MKSSTLNDNDSHVMAPKREPLDTKLAPESLVKGLGASGGLEVGPLASLQCW